MKCLFSFEGKEKGQLTMKKGAPALFFFEKSFCCCEISFAARGAYIAALCYLRTAALTTAYVDYQVRS